MNNIESPQGIDHPDILVPVLQHLARRIRAQTVGVEWPVMIGRKGIAVISLEAIIGRDPDKAFVILNNGIYMTAAETVAGCNIVEDIIGPLRRDPAEGQEKKEEPHKP